MPADSDERVPLTLAALEIHFDRPMSPAIAIYGTPPEIAGRPAWSEDGTILKIPVKLTAGQRYSLVLGSKDSSTFVSKQGEKLVPRKWSFRARE